MLDLDLGLGLDGWHLGAVLYSLILLCLLADHVMRKGRRYRGTTTLRDMDTERQQINVSYKPSYEPERPLRAPDADLFVHEERDSEPPPTRFVRRTRSGRIYSEYCW